MIWFICRGNLAYLQWKFGIHWRISDDSVISSGNLAFTRGSPMIRFISSGNLAFTGRSPVIRFISSENLAFTGGSPMIRLSPVKI